MAQSHGVCNGEGCVSRNPWPIHHVRHRNNLCRLCTSCVLRIHPGSFCPKCFDLIEPSHSQPLVHCVSCTSVCHVACLSAEEKNSGFICPCCASPNFSYFPLEPRVIDLKSAKVLLAAARLASLSMQRAVAAARAEAERKAKESVMARKKAQEILEKVYIGPMNGPAEVVTPLAMVESRWMDVKEAVPLAQRSPAGPISVVEPGKLTLPNNESKDNGMIVPAPTAIVPARNQGSDRSCR
ncbi:uncharacterized protein LOC144712847 isoform X2 [Wolffia australiana]